MKTIQLIFRQPTDWVITRRDNDLDPESCDLVLAFGSRRQLSDPSRFEELRSRFPLAKIVLSTTSGEICGTNVYDDSIVVTGIELEKTQVEVVSEQIADEHGSADIGFRLGNRLLREDLTFVLLIADGQVVNGSELVEGIQKALPPRIPVTGGLAGDGDRFEETLVGMNAPPVSGNVVAVGFYGSHLRVGHGSMGGWDDFGPERTITKSKGNVLYELDGRNALDMYKLYLGDFSKDLPSAALLFPLSIKSSPDAEPVVRTILSIDEQAKSMTFAGDLPEGSLARLMKANFDKLIDGAEGAAQISLHNLQDAPPELLILISCVGRKLVLNQRIEEEVEVVQEVFGENNCITGFYSYGEISPFNPSTKCQLHNQTMTITALSEA